MPITPASDIDRRDKISGRFLKSHGDTKTNFYSSWRGMHKRCYEVNSIVYPRYGGRGIVVCDRWHDYESFKEDMFSTYKKGLTLDRIDVNGNYEPSNCRWATRTEQARNRRNTILFTYKGITKTLPEWSEETGVKFCTLFWRYKRWGHVDRVVEKLTP
jgi:hypothetical protein